MEASVILAMSIYLSATTAYCSDEECGDDMQEDLVLENEEAGIRPRPRASSIHLKTKIKMNIEDYY